MVDGGQEKAILDVCCGTRMMWFDRAHPGTVFGDARSETLKIKDRSHGKEDGVRTLRIEPDTMMDFRSLPFADDTFRLVAFDPPHLVRVEDKSWLAAKYGRLSMDWREDIRKGFTECFRVLTPGGVLVFKWNETQIKLGEVVRLSPFPLCSVIPRAGKV